MRYKSLKLSKYVRIMFDGLNLSYNYVMQKTLLKGAFTDYLRENVNAHFNDLIILDVR